MLKFNNTELVFFSGATLLESPVWSAKHNSIFCVSIEENLIYQISYKTKEINSFQTNGPVGCVVETNDGKLLSAEKEGIFEYDIKSGRKKFIIQIEKDKEMRYNDGKLDPIGRFLVGTKGWLEEKPGKAKLYSYENGNYKTIIEGLTISNGIGFSADSTKMYFIDTPTKKVALYNYNLETGEAKFEKYIIEIPGDGYPDGMCVDIDNNIWVAEWEGGKVCKWNPETGKKIVEIKLPCKRATSCCLGGENLDYLFITTAIDEKIYEPLAGGLFKVKIR